MSVLKRDNKCADFSLDGAESSVDLPVGEVSVWWQSVRQILAKSVLVGQALIMAVVCRSVAMEIQSAAQKVKVRLSLKNVF